MDCRLCGRTGPNPPVRGGCELRPRWGKKKGSGDGTTKGKERRDGTICVQLGGSRGSALGKKKKVAEQTDLLRKLGQGGGRVLWRGKSHAVWDN